VSVTSTGSMTAEQKMEPNTPVSLLSTYKSFVKEVTSCTTSSVGRPKARSTPCDGSNKAGKFWARNLRRALA